MWHWAHLVKRICDPWWENETEWHRAWKDRFPSDWQEIVHFAESGEKHIADVKTDQDWVVEFQHSFLNPEERRARNSFYQKLVWVVNGLRRKTDKIQFSNALNKSAAVGVNSPVRRISADECVLLREWYGSHAPIFFDFGEATQPEKSVLWLLFPYAPDGMAYLAPFSRTEFVDIYRNGSQQKAREFEKLLKDFPGLVLGYKPAVSVQAQSQTILQPQPNRSYQHKGFGRSRRF